jgi:hypothetical protein
MLKFPIVNFCCHGQVKQDELKEIQSVLQECYLRLARARPLPDRVEVHLFETAGVLFEYFKEEKQDLGIGTSGDEAFICSHDAWRGYSRLSICLERLNRLSSIARLGALRHEVAHSVLHGGPEYYTVRIAEDCVEIARTRGMAPALLQQVLYYCAVAVKDFEVTRLLLESGYSECQAAFVETVFLPSEDDKLAWSMLKSHPQGKFIFFGSQLKTLMLGMPLETAGLVELESLNDQMLYYTSPEERRDWLGFARNLARQLGVNTHENIRLALRAVLQLSVTT